MDNVSLAWIGKQTQLSGNIQLNAELVSLIKLNMNIASLNTMDAQVVKLDLVALIIKCPQIQ